MKVYTLEARDTVLFRDARPFTGTAGAHSMPAPWPSTIAGFFRTRLGIGSDGKFDTSRIDALKATSVAGPWLVELDENDEVIQTYVPAPADCVFFAEAKSDDAKDVVYTKQRLAPAADAGGFVSDLNDVDGAEQLVPLTFVGAEIGNVKGKPASGPAWWSWDTMKAWLERPPSAADEGLTRDDVDALGVAELESEERTHVAIDGETLTAEEGKLFVTSMRRMTHTETGGDGLKIRRFALAAALDGELDADKLTMGTLGGERRLSFLRAGSGTPEAPAVTGSRLRVVLVTPGLFDAGWRPSAEKLGGARLIGAAVGRWQSVSGWDFKERAPKAARRMVPAGSVFWLEFDDEAAAKKWAADHHFTSIADNEQDARDGFGLCIVGKA